MVNEPPHVNQFGYALVPKGYKRFVVFDVSGEPVSIIQSMIPSDHMSAAKASYARWLATSGAHVIGAAHDFPALSKPSVRAEAKGANVARTAAVKVVFERQVTVGNAVGTQVLDAP